MLETLLTLSDTKNHPFNEQIDFFKNHNPFFAQVSTPAWGYHVVTNFRFTPKRVVQYLVHNARQLYCASLFGTIRKLNFKEGPKPKFRDTFGRLTIRPNVFLAFRIPWFSIPSIFQIDFSTGSE